MPRPSRNEIYESVIRKMVMQALEEQELQFTRDHAFDTDEQLLDYIRKYAVLLHYAPRYKEIIGWKLICERFGSWGAAIEKQDCTFHPAVPLKSFQGFRRKSENKRNCTGRRKQRKSFCPSSGGSGRKPDERNPQRKNRYIKVCVSLFT